MAIRNASGVLGLVLATLVLGAACGRVSDDAKTSANWLTACSGDAACLGGSRCLCGTCTEECTSDDACSSVPSGACATSGSAAFSAACTSEPHPGVCLAVCGSGCSGDMTCVGGLCVSPPSRDAGEFPDASVPPDASVSPDGSVPSDASVDGDAGSATDASILADASDDADAGDSQAEAAAPGYTQQELFGDGTAYGSFGQSVALSADALVIGQPTSADAGGAAYIFREISGTWTQEQELNGGSGFATAVSMSGDTVVIGEPDAGSTGLAYVFVRAAGIWQQQTMLTVADLPSGASFGVAVAVSGDTAIIGAPLGGGDTDTSIGRAYVFVRSGTTWTQQGMLAPAEAIVGDRPGASVAISGDTAIIGAPTNPTFSAPAPGKAYAFTRSAGTWSEQALLSASDGSPKDGFGYAVSLQGGTALVGATCPCAGAGPGAAYVFTQASSTWSQSAKLVSVDSSAGDQFGYQVSLGSGRAIIGAYLADAGQGAAYEFTGAGASWVSGRKLVASDAAAGDNLGFSVALDGSTVVAGSVCESQQAARAGAGYVFELESAE